MIMNALILTVSLVLMFIGLLGSFLPFIPGSPLILVGAFIYAWHTDFLAITWGILVLLLFLTTLSQALEYFSSLLGAKKFGASRWGLIGAFLGGIIGLFGGGIPGFLIGPFVGAFLLELFHGRNLSTSLKIGWGTLLGFFGGAIGKIIIALVMIGIFLIKIT